MNFVLIILNGLYNNNNRLNRCDKITGGVCISISSLQWWSQKVEDTLPTGLPWVGLVILEHFSISVNLKKKKSLDPPFPQIRASFFQRCFVTDYKYRLKKRTLSGAEQL